MHKLAHIGRDAALGVPSRRGIGQRSALSLPKSVEFANMICQVNKIDPLSRPKGSHFHEVARSPSTFNIGLLR